MTCTACRLGRIWECRQHGNCNSTVGPNMGVNSSSDNENPSGVDSDSDDSRGPVREIKGYKNDATMRDQQSTGRKRAAVMYPLDKEAPCEWRENKNCGGGKHPIVGCVDGLQQARHHGPDKNTLNNDEGNVHRICSKCHNRWHARNDPDYIWGAVYNPHSPSPCSQDELIKSELEWLGVKLENVVD